MSGKAMLSMIIRTNLISPDILINVTDKNQLNAQLEDIITQASNHNSSYYIQEDHFYQRMIDCTLRLAYTDPHVPRCPLIFDSWSCYNSTPAETVMTESCPSMPNFNFAEDKFSTKVCTAEGTWWVHPESNRTWSNYTGCLDLSDLSFRKKINMLNDVGLVVSLISLIISISIFTFGESLHCGRISVHKNMFISLVLNNLCWILWGKAVLLQPEVWSNNPPWCRVFNILMTYFTTTTYFWMMCEGGYLHMILFNTLENDSKRLQLLLVIGWGLPIMAVTPYAGYRQYMQNSECWMEMGVSSWFVGVPVVIIMIINMAMLINVIIVLRSKLEEETNPIRRNSRAFTHIKQLKAVCVLVPVLGIHFLLVPIRPEPRSRMEQTYDVLLTLSSSFQGKIGKRSSITSAGFSKSWPPSPVSAG